ncbi:PIN domain-containing protein [Niabella sp.]|uniref:type II toxin-antitoxin system VapC family toxin n=1 Tax=Niabella sp. TaxID=1962976 RepID=UPI002627E906|nr:PIN domain-containing protein [Niabella sp.]
MAFKIFIDTNIIVDFFVASRLLHQDAVKMVNAIEDGLLKGYVSESVINTTSYLVRKSSNIDGYRKQMLNVMTILNVLPCTNDIINAGFRSAKNDLEDAVLYQIALAGKMDYFITSNIKDFKRLEQPLLPVITPKEILTIIV